MHEGLFKVSALNLKQAPDYNFQFVEEEFHETSKMELFALRR